MARRSALDQRFAQFCRSGEPAALGEVFDGTARELLHVAVWLAGNRTDAEDLLQRTFLCAIETRARFDPAQPVLPWLMGILAIEARHLRRERERRVAAAPAAPIADPEAEVAANELDAAVRAIGEELGEPYRDVLRLHLQQGLNAKEIAERLQRPGGTVRTQLVRALELLRRRLPGGFVAGLAPLVLPQHAVLGTARAAVMQAAKLAMPTAMGATTTWTVTGSLTMSKKFAAVAAVALLLVAGAVAWVQQGDAKEPAKPQPLAVQGEVGRAAGDAAAMPVTTQRAELPPPQTAAAATTGTLLVHVFWQKDDSPAAAVGVAIWPQQGYAVLHERQCVSDAAGECRFVDLTPGDYSVQSASRITRTVRIAAGAVCELRLGANHSTTVHGQVVDEFARPMPGADIWLSEDGTWFRGYVVAQSDAGGHFSVPADNNEYIGARKAGYIASYCRGFHAFSGDPPKVQRDFEFTLQLRGAAGAVRGRVVDAARQPIAGARVCIGPQTVQQAPGLRGLNGEHEPLGVTVVADNEGNFARDDVPPGPTDVRAWADGHGPSESGVVVQASATAVIELMLPAPAILQGVVRDGEGKPIEGAQLQIGSQHDFLAAATQSTADGTYRLGGLAAGPAKVTVIKPGALSLGMTVQHHDDGTSTLGAEGKDNATRQEDLKAETTVTLAAGITTTWDPVLNATRILRGIVLDSHGQPMRDVYIGIEAWLGHGGSASHALVGDDGRFAIANVAPECTQILTVLQGASELHRTAVPPGQDDVTVRLDDEDLPTASLRLRLVDAAGQPVAATVMFQAAGDNASRGIPQDAATGIACNKAMRAGNYELNVCTSDMTLPLPSVTLAPHEDKDLGDVVVPAAAILRLSVRTVDGKPLGASWIGMVSATGQSCVTNPPRLRGGEVEVTAPPGTWILIVNTPQATAATSVTLQSGTTTACELTMPACADVPIEIVPDASVFAFGMMRVLVHRQDGQLQYCGNVFTQRDGSIRSTLHLPPGDYSFTAIGRDDSRCTVACRVAADGATAAVRIPLHPAAH